MTSLIQILLVFPLVSFMAMAHTQMVHGRSGKEVGDGYSSSKSK